MRRTKRRDTKPEIALRSAVHAMKLRYFVDRAPLPDQRRRADLVFPRAQVAVYVDGCFWHGCPLHATWPEANADFWRQKIEANRARDLDTDERLAAAGWVSFRVWEHEDPTVAAERLAELVRARR